jgi:hypothetical protein
VREEELKGGVFGTSIVYHEEGKALMAEDRQIPKVAESRETTEGASAEGVLCSFVISLSRAMLSNAAVSNRLLPAAQARLQIFEPIEKLIAVGLEIGGARDHGYADHQNQ